MPKINVYLPEALADAVRDAQLPVSAICQSALERAVRDVTSARASDEPPDLDARAFGLFGRFTPRARRAVELAEQAARDIPHNYVGTEHLLLGMLDEGTNLGLRMLEALDVETDDIRAELVASMAAPTKRAKGTAPFTPLAKLALEETAKEAVALGHNYIGCEHLLLGVLATEDGLGSHVLRRLGLELRTTRRAVITALAGYVQASWAAAPTPTPTNPSSIDEVLHRLDQRLEAIERRLDAN